MRVIVMAYLVLRNFKRRLSKKNQLHVHPEIGNIPSAVGSILVVVSKLCRAGFNYYGQPSMFIRHSFMLV